ncbi:acetyltransferase [Scandinavium goeteborgense]|uniref:acetyltransferase n=1 Tax=Scandinavium goeteborgense TaxID=1851514 RepID=UPI0037F13119
MNDADAQKGVVLIGGGGHASVIADILKQQHREIKAIISPVDVTSRTIFDGIDVLKHDDDIEKFDPKNVTLVNCIGVLPGSATKKAINEKYLAKGYSFETIVANDAYVSPYAILSPGSQIFTGAIIQAGAVIGSHTVINTGAIIEHDSRIGSYNFVAPRAVLCGQCETEDDVFIGVNATIIQSIRLGKGTVVTAGALVTKNTLPGQKVSVQRSIVR